MQTGIKAFAKINLFLKVMETRPDSYHNIRGIVAPVSLYDEIDIEETESARVETLCDFSEQLSSPPWSAPPEISSDNNLATRAAQIIQKLSGKNTGLKIKLRKHIPVAAGLGGGSSDAASVLMCLNKAWTLNMPDTELADKSAGLGCDIPALIYQKPVLAEGKGERITPLKTSRISDIYGVLVNPGLHISTGNIYSQYNYDLTSSESDNKFNCLVSGLENGCLSDIAGGMHNDLESVGFKKYPLLEIIKEKLIELGALSALMSGSGASVFGLAQDKAQAEEIAAKIPESAGCPLWREVVSFL